MVSKKDKKNKKLSPVLSGIVALIVVVAVVLGVLNSDIGLDKHEVKAGVTAECVHFLRVVMQWHLPMVVNL